MADIKAADVAKLRKSTGAGMMDCKKALQEANGDFEKAIDLIRQKVRQSPISVPIVKPAKEMYWQRFRGIMVP